MSKGVQCTDCGSLALRHATTLAIVEADQRYRDNGIIPEQNGRYVFQEAPVCTQGLRSFNINGLDRGGCHMWAKAPHDCEKFVQYQSGLTPDQHREMKLLAEVERRTKAWRDEDREQQASWRAEDTKRQQAIEALYETRHQELRRDRRETLIWTAIVAIAAAVIGGLITRQWGP